MKRITQKSILFITILLIMLIYITPVMAYTPPIINPESPGEAGNKIEDAGAKIAGLISVIAAVVAIVILIWLAIKYMTAAPSDKADIKKSAVTYVIGAVLLFAASGVLGIIANFGKGLFAAGVGSGESNYEHVQGGTEVMGTGE